MPHCLTNLEIKCRSPTTISACTQAHKYAKHYQSKVRKCEDMPKGRSVNITGKSKTPLLAQQPPRSQCAVFQHQEASWAPLTSLATLPLRPWVSHHLQTSRQALIKILGHRLPLVSSQAHHPHRLGVQLSLFSKLQPSLAALHS